MSTAYQPRPGSLASAIAAFFKANPDEELSGPQVDAKWPGYGKTGRSTALGALEDADYVVSRREGVTNIYSAGPALARWLPAADDTAATGAWSGTPPPSTAPRPPPRRVALPPATALVIEDGVPLPRLRTPANGSPYDEIFAAMKPGQSFTQPHEQAKSLKTSADRWAKRHAGGKVKFALRQISDTHSRVWRKE